MQGQIIMPGISEMHAHIPCAWLIRRRNDIESDLFLYLANGITTIRGTLGQAFHLNIEMPLSQKAYWSLSAEYVYEPFFQWKYDAWHRYRWSRCETV